MKHSGKMLFCLLAAVASGTGAYAISTDSPYQGIAVRNVFGLRAPPAPETNQVVAAPPVKIIPSGVTDILGKKLVLLKIQVPAKPPMAASEQSHIMGIGDRQGEVEVVDIDEKAGVIKFKNHGIEVTLSLEKDGAKLPNTPPPAVVAGAPGAPNAPNIPGAINFVPQASQGTPGAHPGATAYSPVGAGSPNNPYNNANNPYNNTGNAYNSGNTGLKGIPSRTMRASGGETPHFQVSPEEQLIMMEVERERNKNNPNFPPLPPTVLNPGQTPGQNPGPNTLPPLPPR